MNLSVRLVGHHVSAGRGHAPAVIDNGRPITFEALQDRVWRLAAGLHEAGVAAGDRVAIALPNGVDLIAVWLAAQHLGAIAVTMAPSLRPRERTALLADASPRLFVAEGDAPAGAASVRSLTSGGSPPPAADPAADAPAVIVYTVGADGRLRGACHSAPAVLAAADAYGRGVLQLRPGDVVGGHPPMAHSYGLGALLVCPFAAGAATAPTSAFDAEALLGSVARDRVTVLFGTATAYRLLLRVPGLAQRFDLTSLRSCVSAGEPLEGAVTAAWTHATGTELLDGFGTTELFHVVIGQRPGDVRPGALGRPVPGYEVRVVDDGMRDVPSGVPGRLAVRGPTRCRYWRQEALEAEVVRDGWTFTGDIVRQDEDGVVWFVRRADALIVSAGYNIAPIEVERVLEEHPDVARAAVAALPDPTRGAVVGARVQLRPGVAPSSEIALALQQHVQRELSPYKCPRRIDFVEQVP